MRRFGLKGKFIVAFVAFTILLSILFGAIAAYRMAYELEEQFVERGRQLAKHTVTETAHLLSLGEENRLPGLLRNLLEEPVIYAQIVQDQRVLAEEKRVAVDLPTEAVTAEFEIRRGRLLDGTPYLDIKQRSSSGYVRLGLSITYIQYEIGQDILIVSGASVGFILLGTLVAFGLYRVILRPVEQLMASVRAFGRGMFEARSSVKSGDELETLSEEFNHMADSIVHTKQELEKSNRAKSEFLTIMGHELRTPLHTLLGSAQLLKEEVEGRLNQAQKKRLDAIMRSGEHLSELIENVLRFSKLEMGEEKLHMEQVDAKHVVEEAMHSVEALALAKKVTLRFGRKSALPLQADRTKLKQILINLLSNAIKYTEQGSVEIRLQQKRDTVLFAVHDSGIGIKEEDQKRIFEPFTQLDASTTRETEGLGLGLAIVKRYVEMHGGRVWVESQLHQGSTFYISLPRRSER